MTEQNPTLTGEEVAAAVERLTLESGRPTAMGGYAPFVEAADLRTILTALTEAQAQVVSLTEAHEAAVIAGQTECRKRVAAEAQNASLREALCRVRQTLLIPAAEYVPAIPDAWAIIDAAVGEG